MLTRSGHKYSVLIALAIVLVYLFLAGVCIETAVPWNDEAWYASPALSLISNGNTGTPILETAGKFWQGIHQRTYWVMPLYFYAEAPWFEIFRFSLTSARAFAVCWGLLAMTCWALIVLKLTHNTAMALVTMALMACDYQFVEQTSLARMDAMAIALAALGILLYLILRERQLIWACFASHAAVVASGLTHPTIGVPAFCVVAFLVIYLDWRRMRIPHVLVSLVPYLAGAAFWWWYISPAPDLFRAQFFGNVTDIDRLGGFGHPLNAVIREAGRYLQMAGIGEGHSPFTKLKAISVVFHFAAVIALLLTSAARRDRGIRTLLWVYAVYLLCMTFYDNTKEVKYAINTIGIYAAITAACIVYYWRAYPKVRLLIGAAAGLLLLTGVSGLLYVGLVKDYYRYDFLPAAEFVERSASPNDLILASSEFGFPLGFNRNIVDDSSFTYNSHKVPKFILVGPGYRNVLSHDGRLSRFLADMLAQHYSLAYSHGSYAIYQFHEKRPF
ncbi:MAG: glycosyltransferase family 39 protein [Acidobacteriaceae bacterium]|nr:glycosyltransferase family 39 protein [Acidobacteriaceae bacterium]